MNVLSFISPSGKDTIHYNVPGIIANGVASFREVGTEDSPGTIVCGNGDAGKLRDDHRGASIACWTFMWKSMRLISVCIVRIT